MSMVNSISGGSFDVGGVSVSPPAPVPGANPSETVEEIVRARISQQLARTMENVSLSPRPAPLIETGRPRDLSAQNGQFFSLRLGEDNVFARSLSLGLDPLGTLVDELTGSLVLRETDAGREPFRTGDAFRDPSLGLNLRGTISRDLPEGQRLERTFLLDAGDGNNVELFLGIERLADDEFRFSFDEAGGQRDPFELRVRFDTDGTLTETIPEDSESDDENVAQEVLAAEYGDIFAINSETLTLDNLVLQQGETELELSLDDIDENLENPEFTADEEGRLLGLDDDEEVELALAEFNTPDQLNDLGNALFGPTEGSGPPVPVTRDDVSVESGVLEWPRGSRTGSLVRNFLADENFIERRRAITRDRGQLLGEIIDFMA